MPFVFVANGALDRKPSELPGSRTPPKINRAPGARSIVDLQPPAESRPPPANSRAKTDHVITESGSRPAFPEPTVTTRDWSENGQNFGGQGLALAKVEHVIAKFGSGPAFSEPAHTTRVCKIWFGASILRAGRAARDCKMLNQWSTGRPKRRRRLRKKRSRCRDARDAYVCA